MHRPSTRTTGAEPKVRVNRIYVVGLAGDGVARQHKPLFRGARAACPSTRMGWLEA